MDTFDKLEIRLRDFINKHFLGITSIIGMVLVVFLFATIIMSMGAATGFGMADQSMQERHDNFTITPSDHDYVSDEAIDSWDNITMPTVVFLYHYYQWVVFVIIALYFSVNIYVIVRYESRRRKRKYESSQLPEEP